MSAGLDVIRPGNRGRKSGFNATLETETHDAAAYQRIYEIKSKDDPKAWADLIKLCKVLTETPSNQLVTALTPLLDIDGALKFLAWENALVKGDGYWTRTSDYSIYEDEKGRFHIIPYYANETFSSGGGHNGPGGRGRPGMRPGESGSPERGNVPVFAGTDTNGIGPGFGLHGRRDGPRGGVELDPLAVANDAGKPLIAKLLAVPNCGRVISAMSGTSPRNGSIGTNSAHSRTNTSQASPTTSRPTRGSSIPRKSSSLVLPTTSARQRKAFAAVQYQPQTRCGRAAGVPIEPSDRQGGVSNLQQN